MSTIEATIICIDNSDYNRNEDIIPNRFLSQIDCVNVLCCNKTSMHYKNNIGIIMMAGDKTKVKVSLTNDIGQLLSCIHDIKLDGTCDVVRSLLIAQLALKHRMDKNLGQKIMLFIGSPFEVNEKQMISTGKQLKKNNICLDIISYGNISKNRDMLMKLFESVNHNDNCRYIECPESENNLSKFVLNSFLNNNDFNIGNMQEDEQLMNAMQMSMEESQHMSDHKNISSSNAAIHSPKNDELPTVEEIENMKDIDNDLKEALILSLKEYTEKNKSENSQSVSKPTVDESVPQERTDKSGFPNGNEQMEITSSQQHLLQTSSEDANSSIANQEKKKKKKIIFDEKNEENPSNMSLVNENYKNNFDTCSNNMHMEETKEKKENESYEKVFKIDKEEPNLEGNHETDDINENIYTCDKKLSKSNDGDALSNENVDITTGPSAQIQDTTYISNILGMINANVNVFKNDESDEKEKEKEKEDPPTNQQNEN